METERRLLCRVGVSRVQRVIGDVVAEIGVELVGSGLGQNLDSTEAELVELRRERILIDPDFTNRAFGRDLAATEAVDEDTRAIWSGGRSGEGGEICREVIRVVRERVSRRPG